MHWRSQTRAQLQARRLARSLSTHCRKWQREHLERRPLSFGWASRQTSSCQAIAYGVRTQCHLTPIYAPTAFRTNIGQLSNEDLRVLLDDDAITSYMDYAGSYNDKGSQCNTLANFIGLDVPNSEAQVSTLVMAAQHSLACWFGVWYRRARA